jgi:hypothetical protein
MVALEKQEMVRLEGGELDDLTICGIASGLTFTAFFFGGPILGIYTLSKAIGTCAIALAVD